MFFDDVIGQQSAINKFKEILESNRLSHAYIFAGPEGVGKFLFARTLAKVLMCENDKDGWLNKGCSACRSCRLIDKNSHPNFRIIAVETGKKEIAIDTVREIERELMLMPFYRTFRVFIVNNAERLNEEAANAFLKTLEEPVKDTIIILVTSSPASLPETVLSRCQIIRFYPLQQKEMNEYLTKHLKIDSEQISFLTSLCDGSIGDAVKLYSGNLLSQRDWLIAQLTGKDYSNIGNKIVSYAKSNAEDNEGIRQGIIWQLKIIGLFIRDALLLHYGLSDTKLLNKDKTKAVKQYQKSYDYKRTEKLIGKLLEAERYLKFNANMNLVTENLFVA